MTDAISIPSLTEALTKRSARAFLSYLAPRSRPLRDYLRQRLERMPGERESFLADPVLEARFGWRSSDVRMSELAGELLEERLVAAMDKPPADLREENQFPRERCPYVHQLQAWRALAEEPARSVLVASGTGSGKTECFLVPILNDLARQARQQGRLVGVQAIFLYPLNALINSQRDRLSAWTAAFGGDVRFCLYNGDTPEAVEKAKREESPAQVLERRTLREDPPPLLVTNATMLEYMLVRRNDAPIRESSQGQLRWIVIDEAHTYVGSQAAELSLLLRRVLHGFGVKAENVRFVATSATIVQGEETDARESLGTFLADLAGVEPSRVEVFLGESLRPEVAPEVASFDEPLPGLAELEEMTADERYRALGANGAVRRVRRALMDGACRLSDLKSRITMEPQRFEPEQLLRVLDLCARAALHGERLLPLRAHLFHRTSRGLWVCCNSECERRQGTPLQDPEWPFGCVYFEPREKCGCGGLVFELARCRGCGAAYLAAEERVGIGAAAGAYYLEPRSILIDEDEVEDDLADAEVDEEGARGPRVRNQWRLVSAEPAPPGGKIHLNVRSGLLTGPGGSGQPVHLLLPTPDENPEGDEEQEQMICPLCGSRESTPGMNFRPAFSGAPFLLSAAIPTLLEHLPPDKKRGEPRPFDGRKLITFSDSRQGTARFALRTQTDAERNHVRAMLYHSVLAAGSGASPEEKEREIAELRQQIADLEKANSPALQQILEERRGKLAEAEHPEVRRLPWSLAVERLRNAPSVRTWLPQFWAELSYGDVARDQVAEFCVLRELLRRPKWQNSVETLGLLALEYPRIRNLTELSVPGVLKSRSLILSDWQDFLTTLVDYFLRANSAVDVPRSFLKWMGAPVRTRWVVAPEQELEDRQQRRWPRVGAQASRSRIVRLLASGLGLHPQEDSGTLNEVLDAAWTAVRPMLRAEPEGYVLDLSEEAELVEVPEAWICPITQRLLARTFVGLTPYLPFQGEADFCCERIRMPRVPFAYWQGETRAWSPAEVSEWLREDPVVREVRRRGVWSDLSERIVALSPYFRAAEHSAQQSSQRLRQLEDDLKAGQVNVLSCSTTMEMGVDIGGISAVAMNNTPPSPASFLQRAGRAGRRDEPVAVTFTMCKSTPHGEMVFNDPRWPFETSIYVPKVSLQSERIVWRHVHALTLTQFLAEITEENVTRLTVGWFFDPEGPGVDLYDRSPAEAFRQWCRDARPLADERFVAGLRGLLRGTVLEGQAPAALLASASDRIQELGNEYLEEVGALRSDRDVMIENGADESSAGVLAIDRQLVRLEGEYLLGELAAGGFLPGYGFPTNVVPFIHTTVKQLREEKRRKERLKKEGREREDAGGRRRGYPTRPLSYAVREYAPGSDVVLDGRVYRSEGVTLSWHIPPGDKLVKEPQAFRHAWRCNQCGHRGTTAKLQNACPACGTRQGDGRFKNLAYFRPSGFAVRIAYEPHNDISYQAYVPVKDPWISAGNEPWCFLPRQLGHYRHSPRGFIFHYSQGASGRGFAVCLRCGRAASHGPRDDRFDVPEALQNHTRLRGGKENNGETRCPGNDVEWGIKKRQALGVESQTDVFELVLGNTHSGGPLSEVAAYSIAIALREALAERLGIDSREVGCATSRVRDEEDGDSGYSVILYDTPTGGAGFVATAAQELPLLLAKARKKLECGERQCDRACQACLLTYDSQHRMAYLDRHEALARLTDELLVSLQLTPEQHYFGEGSEMEMSPLADAIRLRMQRRDVFELRLGLTGESLVWDVEGWNLRADLQRWAYEKRPIRLLVERGVLKSLETFSVNALAQVSEIPGVEVWAVAELEKVGGSACVVAELIGKSQRILWASRSPEALAPGESWGVPGGGEIIVRGTFEGAPGKLAGEPLSAAELRRPYPGTVTQIAIQKELDGPANELGEKLWQMVLEKIPDLKTRIQQGQPLAEIRYSDRYVVSPLTARLLMEVLWALCRYPGLIDEETRLLVRTSFRSGPKYPKKLKQNWSHERDCSPVIEKLVREIQGDAMVEFGDQSEVPHHRELRLRWHDGKECWLRPDHGLGYWHARGEPDFDFEADSGEQAEALRDLVFEVEAGQSHPTLIYVSAVTVSP